MNLPSLSIRKLTAFGSLIVVAVSVSACGGSSGSSSSESTPATTEASTPATSAPTTTTAGHTSNMPRQPTMMQTR